MKHLRNIIGMVIIGICFLWTAAVGGQVRLAFDQPDPDLLEAHLRELTPHGESVFLAAFPIIAPSVGPASPVITITADLPVGETRVQVCVRNSHGWSELSEPLTVVVPPSWSLEGNILTTGDGVRIGLSIEFSPDLQAWSDRPAPTARFYRIKASSTGKP